MRAVGIIPARFGSTRFPGKALADLLGKPVIQWVYEGCLKAKTLDQLLVATDDDRIYRTVEGFGGKVVMTSSAHVSGTDRVAEVAKGLKAEVVVNIQGDEPFIEGGLIDQLVEPFSREAGLRMATAAAEFREGEDVADPNVVKVVYGLEGDGLYFSRSPIPFRRNPTEVRVLKHIGIYAYRREFLLRFAEWEPTPLERTEGLEQLRALEHGERIKVVRTDYNPLGVDTPEDLEKARAVASGQWPVAMSERKTVLIGGVKVGGERLVFIGGPCVIESEEHCLMMARELKAIAAAVGMGFIFKSSYDKANRSSLESYRGPGLEEGLRILARVKEEVKVPVLSDVHSPEQVKKAAEVLDCLQIPAFLCRQTDLLLEAGKSGKPVNIKKGQFLSPYEMKFAIDKVLSTGNDQILMTERGTTFGYNNLVVDMRSLVILRGFGYPVVFDGTHSVQMPGAGQGRSGGQREFVVPLCRAVVAVGVDAVFLEVHDDPERALCDGPNMVRLGEVGALLRIAKEIDRIGKGGMEGFA